MIDACGIQVVIKISLNLCYSQMQFSFFQIAFLAIISPAFSLSDHPAPAYYVQRGGHSGNPARTLRVVIRTNHPHTVVAQLGDFLYIDGGWIQQYQDGRGDQTPFLTGNVMYMPCMRGWLHPLNPVLIYLFAIVNSTLSIPLGTAWTNATLNMTDIAKAGAPVLIEKRCGLMRRGS